MAQVKIPGVGPVDSKWALAGGALIVGIAGFAWYRYMNAPAGAEPGAADFTQASETLYGDPGNMAFATDFAYDGGAYPYPSFTTPSYGLTTTVQTAAPVTNPEWTSRSIEHLEAVGVEANAASLAVSRYLLKECLTATQADIVRQAVGGVGLPPQGAFSIIVCPGPPPTTTPPPAGGGSTTTPGTITGLKVTRADRYGIALDWAPTPNARGYKVWINGRHHTTVVWSNYYVRGLRPNTSYRLGVNPIRPDGSSAGPGTTITARTKR